MSIAPWLLPVLWREHDWRGALERLRLQLATVQLSPQSQRASIELGRAFEYVEPDRFRAIAAYALAGPGGDLGRARELALELGWWPACARLSLAARGGDADRRLVLDEAEAWWDAGQPALCALALAELRGEQDHTTRASELHALVAGNELRDVAAEAAARASSMTGTDAADAYVMAARLCRAAGRPDDSIGWLEAALVALPGHRTAASFLLGLALDRRDPEAIQRYLQVRLDGVAGLAAIDGMRSSALALIRSGHHRGFGLRLLRQALERAYEWQLVSIPAHLAMWSALVDHASADGTRRELLPLVLAALQSCNDDVDRVWLGALATEITLRDAGNPVVAGAYAEIVAEFAPEHPIVRELISAVAAADPEPNAAVATPASVPEAATTAARVLEDAIDIDLDDELVAAYAVAAQVATLEPVAYRTPVPSTTTPPSIAKPTAAPSPVSSTSTPVTTAKPSAVARSTTSIPSIAKPTPATTPAPIATRSAPPTTAGSSSAKPTATTTARSLPAVISPTSRPAVGPTLSSAKLAAPSISSTKPAARAGSLEPAPHGSAAVLAALRTPDRPVLPPREQGPSDAVTRARRISIPIDVRLILADGTKVDSHSRDISISGLFVLTRAKLAVNDEISVVLLLPSTEPFMEDEYPCRARVARQAEDGYGLELIAPNAALLAALAAL